MKKCNKCKEYKKLCSFNKDNSRKDGLQKSCRECQSLIRKTDKARETTRKYQKTKRGKEAKKEPLGNTQTTIQKKRKAHQAVQYALKTGQLIRPPVCESCFGFRFVESHHEDYSKPLDVNWLCKECHQKKGKTCQQSNEIT